ncbi:hypothetical protein JHK85_025451 [Glycine max]|nr:hypothetical protein JHK87_024779 [Glycine soja]KAG5006909.1 hypothetical protein JHK85_025451 [Glycine max]
MGWLYDAYNAPFGSILRCCIPTQWVQAGVLNDQESHNLSHTNPDLLTILVQVHVGGLQVLVQNHWIDMPSIPGALVVNTGDLLQENSGQRAHDGSMNNISGDKSTDQTLVAKEAILFIPFLLNEAFHMKYVRLD